MPRKATTASSPASSTPVEDPLADLREDEPAARYPEDGQNGTQEGPEAPGEADPLVVTILAALETAMAIPQDNADELNAVHTEMATALANETADTLRPSLTPAVDVDEVVERWHENTVALGFLHKGGRCGCAYIARAAFGA